MRIATLNIVAVTPSTTKILPRQKISTPLAKYFANPLLFGYSVVFEYHPKSTWVPHGHFSPFVVSWYVMYMLWPHLHLLPTLDSRVWYPEEGDTKDDLQLPTYPDGFGNEIKSNFEDGKTLVRPSYCLKCAFDVLYRIIVIALTSSFCARLVTGGDRHGCHGPRADRQLQGGVFLKAPLVVLFFAREVLIMLEGGMWRQRYEDNATRLVGGMWIRRWKINPSWWFVLLPSVANMRNSNNVLGFVEDIAGLCDLWWVEERSENEYTPNYGAWKNKKG